MALPPISNTNVASIQASQQVSMKSRLVESSVNINLDTGQKPLALLYRSAVEKLNEYLEPELGTGAIQNAAQSGMDFSPEAVAERIVSFATGFFGAYAERHGDESQNEQLDGFMDLIGGAIEKGFNEAKEILEGLSVFQGEIADNANRTYDLIQEKLAAFEQRTRDGFEVLA